VISVDAARVLLNSLSPVNSRRVKYRGTVSKTTPEVKKRNALPLHEQHDKIDGYAKRNALERNKESL
jgi:hypothetical protein